MEKKLNSSFPPKDSHNESKEREREPSVPRDKSHEEDRERERDRERDSHNRDRERERERDSRHSRLSKPSGQINSYSRPRSISHSYSPHRSNSRYRHPYSSSRDRDRDRERERDFRPRERFYHRNSRSPRMKYHRKTSRDNSSENKGNVLYVSNLPRKLKEGALREKFGKYGKIEMIDIVKEPFSKESRGFGFITYEDPKSAAEAISALNKSMFEDKTITVEISKRSRPHKPTPGVYLGPKTEDYNRRRYDRREMYYRGGRSRSRSRRSHSRSRSRSYYRNSMSRSRPRRSRSRRSPVMYHSRGRYS